MDYRTGMFADVHDADPRGRARPSRAGTVDAPSPHRVVPPDGPRLAVHGEVPEANGLAE